MEMNKKGVVFSLDAAIAVTVIIIILINSAYYFSTSSKESLSQLQPVRIGSDIVAILDYTNILDQIVFNDIIEKNPSFLDLNTTNLSRYLPANYDMKLSISDLAETIIDADFIDKSTNTVCAPSVPGNLGSCLLPSSGDFVNMSTFPIETAGEYYIIVKANTSKLAVTVDITQTAGIPYFEQPNVFLFDKLYFTQGINFVHFELTNSTPITLEWFKVLGEDGYAMGNDKTIPNDRFVGTGERFISVEEGDHFEGFYNVRYWIWLKSTP